jgi:hypothetical protein
MRFVATDEVEDGARLGMDVFGGLTGTVPLLRAGVSLDPRYRRALLDAGIERILVDDSESQGIIVTTSLTDVTRQEATQKLEPLLDRSRYAIVRGDRVSANAVAIATRVASIVAEEVLDTQSGVMSFADGFGPRGYRLQHPIDVTVLGLLIAQRLFEQYGRIAGGGVRTTDGVDDALRRLSFGLLLHDVGAVDGFEGVRLRNGLLDQGALAPLSAHTQAGNDALPFMFVSAHAVAAVRCHHEHWDGTGPRGLRGSQIPQFARIAAVADVFDALTSSRDGHVPETAHAAVEAITEASGTIFDPEVVEVFCTIVAPFPPGTPVTLSDGSSGIVTDVPADALHRPRVRLLRDAAGIRLEPVEFAVGGGQSSLSIAAAA